MFFLSGTDTDCGKTTIGRALCSSFSSRGVTIAPFKPFETGCVTDGDVLLGPDSLALSQASRSHHSIDVLSPYRFRLPASPERAASFEGITELSLAPIQAAFHNLSEASDIVIVEGAGGLLVPITSELFMIDLPRILDIPILLVARDSLGTVNHSLLSIEAIRSRCLPLLGIVFSSLESPSPHDLKNVEAIIAHSGVRSFGVLPYLPGADDVSLRSAAERHLDLDGLLSLLI